MPTDLQAALTSSAPSTIQLAPTLSSDTQEGILSLLALLPKECFDSIPSIMIKKWVDGRGLACPMPLLKTKVALRDVNVGESLYMVATDPNSQADIQAFCQHTQKNSAVETLVLTVNHATASDTIFHFIITKTDSN